MKLAAGALLMAMTTGCTPPPATPAGEAPIPERGAGTCEASKAKALVGRARSEAVGNEALRLTGATTLRWIAPGTMVTMDYREDRLNLHLGSDGKIARIACG